MKVVSEIDYNRTVITHIPTLHSFSITAKTAPVAARFVTTARFVTKVTKRAAMPARFVTNEVVTNCAGIAPFFFSLGYYYI